jgi:hypothetical protein
MIDAVGSSRTSDALVHPVVVSALSLWLLNDHVLKHAYANWWTGKLSDAAGLIVFPCFLAVLIELVSPLRRVLSEEQRLVLAVVTTMLAFTAVKLWLPAAWSYQWGLGLAQWPWHALNAALANRALPHLSAVALSMDPTDLWTLPFALVPVFLRSYPASWFIRAERNVYEPAQE